MLSKFLNLFGAQKEEPSSLTDFRLMAVDLHSHFIPGIDDGIKTLEESVDTLREFEKLGFKKVITTPHVLVGAYDNTSEAILKGRDRVREAIKEAGISIQFDAAAEYYLDETIYEKIEKKDILKLGHDYMLMEFSLSSKPHNVADVVYKLQVAGYNVVLAHPERYPYYYEKNFSSYEDLKDRGIFFQINMLSLMGRYGKGAKSVAEKLIDDGMVDFIGTDLHGMRHVPAIHATLQAKYLEKLLTSDKLLNKTLL